MGELKPNPPPPRDPQCRVTEMPCSVWRAPLPPPPHPIFSCYRRVQINAFPRNILISFGPRCCLPFQQVNQSVHGLDKREVKFRTYHLHQSVPFIEKRSQTPETSMKDGFLRSGTGTSVWNTVYSVRENRTIFSDLLLLPEIFHCNDPEMEKW